MVCFRVTTTGATGATGTTDAEVEDEFAPGSGVPVIIPGDGADDSMTTPVTVGLFTGVIVVQRSVLLPQETRVKSEAIITNGRAGFFIESIL